MPTRLSSLLALLFLATTPAIAQPPATTCGLSDSLGSGDFFPIDATENTSSNDFTMTGTGCAEHGVDHVTCMTPTTSCTVNAQCSDNFTLVPVETDRTLGLQVAVNAVQGSCSTSPATCLDSGVGTGSGAITNLALTGGTTYCFVCEAGGSSIDLRLEIQAASGDCGALPVELLSLEIE